MVRGWVVFALVGWFLSSNLIAMDVKTYEEYCKDLLQDVPPSTGYIEPGSNKLYFLARIRPQTINQKQRVLHRYFRFNFETKTLSRLFEISVPDVDYIVPQGSPNLGVLLVDQIFGKTRCLAGEADFLFLSLAGGSKNWNATKVPRGRKTLVPIETATSIEVFDFKDRNLLRFDPQSLQLRHHLVPVGLKEALGFIQSPSTVGGYLAFVIDSEKGHRGVIRYRSAGSVGRRLQIKSGDKAVRTKGGLALLGINHNSNSVEVTFVPGWSNVLREVTHEVRINRSQLVSRARFLVNSRRGYLVVVGGEGRSPAQSDRSVSVYELRRGNQLASYRATIGSQIGFVAMDAKTGMLSFEIRESRAGLTDKIVVASPANWRWEKIPIPRQ